MRVERPGLIVFLSLTTLNHFGSMEQWKDKVALVTGASAGIGYDLSKQLCELGMNVVGCARNIGKIKVLYTIESFQ